MKKLLLLITLMICVTGFSQTTKQDLLQIQKQKKEMRLERPTHDHKILYDKDLYLKTLLQKNQTNAQMPAKSSRVLKQCLDSIVSATYKETFLYDNRGNHTLYMCYNWDEVLNQWQENAKTERTYNEKDNVTKISYYYLDENNVLSLSMQEEYEWDTYENMTMELFFFWIDGDMDGDKREYEYDADRREIVNIRYDWDGDDWLKLYKGETTYGDNGKMSLYVDSEWDGVAWQQYYKIEHTYNENDLNILWIMYDWTGSAWEFAAKGETTYNDHGNFTNYVEYLWDGSEWVKIDMSIEKYDYEYDPAGNITLKISYWCDWFTGEFLPQMKEIYEYNAAGNVTMSESYGRDWDGGGWVGWSKYDYEYDAVGNPTVLISYFWGLESNEWELNTKDEYTFDEVGNQIMTINYLWESNTWVESGKYTDTYDINYPKTVLVIPGDRYMEYKLLDTKCYGWNGLDWTEWGAVFYHWTERDINSITDRKPQSTSIVIYPNPVNAELHVKLASTETATYTIYNNMGQRMMSGQVQDGATINIQSLSAGIYFLNVLGQTIKVVKQ